MRVAAALLLALAITAPAEERGQAQIAMQGYYLGGSSQRLSDTSGMAVHFRYFLPRLGFLNGNFEGYGAQGKLRTGDNYLSLRGVPWAGRNWSFTAGDFRFGASMVEFPFYNLFLPEVMARGMQIEAVHGTSRYSFFFGTETLLTGPRVPFRVQAPQDVLGAAARYHIAKRWQLAFRYLRLRNHADDAARTSFILTREFRTLESVSAQSLYSVTKAFRLYAEGVRTLRRETDEPVPGRPVPGSLLAGAVFDTAPLTIRANYAYQGSDYLPLAGYFSGDRRGPYLEVRLRPLPRVELFGSANRYGNNLERDPDAPTYHSVGESAGISISLPWKFSVNGQVSTVDFTSHAESGAYASRNRQMSANLARTFHRHTVRIGVRELRTAAGARMERQKTREIEDFVAFGRFSVGGAARLQQSASEQRRNTLFFRGSGQARFGPFSFYVSGESGNDLVNRTVFATSAFSSTCAGMSARLRQKWSMQVDAYRNRLIQDLNPENIFLLEGRGFGLSSALSRFEQWSLFFRVSREVYWGGAVPAAAGQVATQQVPLTGAVEGIVHERSLAAQRPAPGIPVMLDGVRSTTSDAEGRFRFAEVNEGVHRIALNLREMPADFDPGSAASLDVAVRARRTTRADLEVLPLTVVQGRIAGPANAVQGILVRLLPTARYTTTDAEGHFAFYNLREGDYEVTVDAATLPPDAVLSSPARFPLAARVGADMPELRFEFTLQHKEKPVRHVILQN